MRVLLRSSSCKTSSEMITEETLNAKSSPTFKPIHPHLALSFTETPATGATRSRSSAAMRNPRRVASSSANKGNSDGNKGNRAGNKGNSGGNLEVMPVFRWPRAPSFFHLGSQSSRLIAESSRSCMEESEQGSPVLLSVRPKLSMTDSCDSGFESTSSRGPSTSPPLASVSSKKTSGRSILRRLFHRSTTILFNVNQVPEGDREQNMPRRTFQPATLENNVINDDSSSSLNNSELHHHLEHDNSLLDSESLSSPSTLLLPNSSPPVFHSSCTSVFSSSADSGQYSSPEWTIEDGRRPPTLGSQRQARSSKDILHGHPQPLSAPALVKAVTGASKSGLTSSGDSSVSEAITSKVVDASHILACLNAAAVSSSCQNRLRDDLRGPKTHVSITVGTDTKLTLSDMKMSEMTATRTPGKPALGTAALGKATPIKPLRQGGVANQPVGGATSKRGVMESGLLGRSKISTVYLHSPRNMKEGSKVTLNSLMGRTPHCNSRYCHEQVTVNGQHPCEFPLRTPEPNPRMATQLNNNGAIQV